MYPATVAPRLTLGRSIGARRLMDGPVCHRISPSSWLCFTYLLTYLLTLCIHTYIHVCSSLLLADFRSEHVHVHVALRTGTPTTPPEWMRHQRMLGCNGNGNVQLHCPMEKINSTIPLIKACCMYITCGPEIEQSAQKISSPSVHIYPSGWDHLAGSKQASCINHKKSRRETRATRYMDCFCFLHPLCSSSCMYCASLPPIPSLSVINKHGPCVR